MTTNIREADARDKGIYAPPAISDYKRNPLWLRHGGGYDLRDMPAGVYWSQAGPMIGGDQTNQTSISFSTLDPITCSCPTDGEPTVTNDPCKASVDGLLNAGAICGPRPTARIDPATGRATYFQWNKRPCTHPSFCGAANAYPFAPSFYDAYPAAYPFGGARGWYESRHPTVSVARTEEVVVHQRYKGYDRAW